MGKLVNFCAGADPDKLPAKKINALLVNVPDHGANQLKIEKAQKMFQLSKPKYVILDSGGFQLLKAEKKSRKILLDFWKILILKRILHYFLCPASSGRYFFRCTGLFPVGTKINSTFPGKSLLIKS